MNDDDLVTLDILLDGALSEAGLVPAKAPDDGSIGMWQILPVSRHE